MSRRETERKNFRRALIPGLVLSLVAHGLALGLLAFDVPLWPSDAEDATREERAERYTERSLEVVALRSPRSSPASPAEEAAAAEASARAAEASTAAPSVRSPSTPSVSAEPVEAPTVVLAVVAERRDERRLSATDLAGMFPGRSQVPKPTSRAARKASGEARDVGDRFEAIGGARNAGPRGGGCTTNPGSLINRRIPSDLTAGGS